MRQGALVILGIVACIMFAWIIVLLSAFPERLWIPKERPGAALKEPYGDWQEWESSEAGFKISVPSQPTDATSEVPFPGSSGNIHYHMFASEDLQGGMYSINKITYPADSDLSKPYDAMEAVIGTTIPSAQGGRREMVRTEWNGLPRVDFTITDSDSQVSGFVVLKGSEMFMVFYLDIPPNFDPKTRDHFLGSFQII